MSDRKSRLLIFIVAYFAERTIERVVRRIPTALGQTYDTEILIIDDGSGDKTFPISIEIDRFGITPFKINVLYNPINQGYGGNQKIGYHYAVKHGFDYVALLHGDGQYPPEMLAVLVSPLRRNAAEAVFGSRFLTRHDTLKGGMPLYKYVGNTVLTAIQNRLLHTKLSEFHSGYRAYSVHALKSLPFERNSNGFDFDTEIIIQLVIAGKRIEEIPIPTCYGDEICRVEGLKYAVAVLSASLQARFQRINLLYDRRFDCAPVADGRRYPSKLGFASSHSRVIELVRDGSKVLDLACGAGDVAMALKRRKECVVVGCDWERDAPTADLDGFAVVDLDEGLPDLPRGEWDYILALDVIEHLKSAEDFLDQLRAMAARSDAQVIITTANVAFLLMRLQLLLGRFEYGKRGILDLTHRRLFTVRSLRRALTAAGFVVQRWEGIPVPMPFVFGQSWLSGFLLWVNRILVRLWPALFGFQLLLVATARPTLDTLLEDATASAQTQALALDLPPGE